MADQADVNAAQTIAMDPTLLGLFMGVAQGVQGQQQEKAQRQVSAATIANAPYTGANINQSQAGINIANPSGAIGQGVLGGMQQAQQNKMGDAYTQWLKNSSSPGASFGPPGPSPYGMSAGVNPGPTQAAAARQNPVGANLSANPADTSGKYTSVGPYSGLHDPAKQAMGMSGEQPGYMNGSLANFPYADAAPPGYRGPTRTRQGTLGPYAGDTGEGSYDYYDQPRAGN